jgi:hypothetical protein
LFPTLDISTLISSHFSINVYFPTDCHTEGKALLGSRTSVQHFNLLKPSGNFTYHQV